MKSLPSILLSAFAIILLTGQASIGGQTTDECLVKPGPPGPKGAHWHYHINRADGQHCWYLSSQGEQTAGQVYPGMQHAEPPNPSPQAADISAPKTTEKIFPESAFPVPAIDTAVLDFARRWPDLPRPEYLASHSEARVDAASKEQITATPPIAESEGASERAGWLPDAHHAGIGGVTFIGTAVVLSLLLVGSILKLVGFLENRLRLARRRLASYVSSNSVKSVGAKLTAWTVKDRIVAQAPTPTDPAQDLKANLRELMQVLRRASDAADSGLSFAPARRP